MTDQQLNRLLLDVLSPKNTRLGICQCTDHQCPAHEGAAFCINEAEVLMVRSDFEDEGGIPMCGHCAEDSLRSGIFTVKNLDRYESV